MGLGFGFGSEELGRRQSCQNNLKPRKRFGAHKEMNDANNQVWELGSDLPVEDPADDAYGYPCGLRNAFEKQIQVKSLTMAQKSRGRVKDHFEDLFA